MRVVVVESPAKAKTINKYLGDDYQVIASYGHVRDLPARDGSVRPDDDFSMDWEIEGRARKHIDAIAKALRGADQLYLATDPDREGEAISWHVCRVLEEQNALKAGLDVKRVVFNEITRDAIRQAFARPRALDQELVDAYLARRALDYLVGFTLSPVLWRKLPGSRSAGRVQSVALRLICERETEIEAFRSQEYWTVDGLFRTPRGETFTATLTQLDGRKLDKFDLGDEAAATAAVAAVKGSDFAVGQIERKQVRRNPAPPFITSTLQQEASRKLGFSASRTMQLAQRLYEGVTIDGETVGLITYMRTDGVTMAADAVNACRRLIGGTWGEAYLPDKPRVYKSRAKNAQEAHEAIRPTDVARRPEDIARSLDADQLKLYTLIWRRTLACQMASAVLDQVAADIPAADGRTVLRATGSTVSFDGFLKVYREGTDDPDSAVRRAKPLREDRSDDDRTLPELHEGEALGLESVVPDQHFTQPPPRYTEASLVKTLEELGIGRPSTYASILSVLQEREYVRLDNKRFVPEDRGRLVTAFLTSFFEHYVAYGFTADMEARLDDVSGGRLDWRTLLRDFWTGFRAAVEETKNLRIAEVLEALNQLLGPHFFGPGDNGTNPRACPSCADGQLSLKVGRYGAFIGCSNYPDCRYTRPLVPVGEDSGEPVAIGETQGRRLGDDPATGLPVTLRKGPYGLYVQLGEASTAVIAPDDDDSKDGEGNAKGKNKGKGKGKAAKAGKAAARTVKPKRSSLPKGVDPDSIDLDQALALLALPRTVGNHPETGEPIVAGIGRFGPYVNMGQTWTSLKGDDDVLTIGLNRAVVLIGEAREKRPPGRALGDHPGDGKPVAVKRGRYGPYVEHNKTRATLPKGEDPDTISLERAVELLAAKASRGEAGGKGAPARTAARAASQGRNKAGTATAKTARRAPTKGRAGKDG